MNTHVPVMVDHVLAALAPQDNEVHVDATFGSGGYARRILAAARCRVLAIDRDPDAVRSGNKLAAESGQRFEIVESRFSSLSSVVVEHAGAAVNGVVFDLGVSSNQLDNAKRGFSFRQDGPLDMRMSKTGPSAADVINTCDEVRLMEILSHYGEERRARAVARAIVTARRSKSISRTVELADIVRSAAHRPSSGLDPATRTFQALRIWINDELGELRKGLFGAEKILCEGGRLAVVAFHSLEDRIVKRFLQERSGRSGTPNRHAPPAVEQQSPSFLVQGKQPVVPGNDEIVVNPRARSARLRWAVRTASPVWSVQQ